MFKKRYNAALLPDPQQKQVFTGRKVQIGQLDALSPLGKF